MIRLFAFAIFLSAAALFLVQPLIGKLLLPILGGAPAVWSTCLVFFQTVLLLGYLYAHFLSKLSSRRAQLVIHGAIGVGVLFTLPVAVPALAGTLDPERPIAWLLKALSLTVGAPFFLLSSTSPLLQRWFSRTDDPRAQDPYFLYAASNAGSIIGLLAYPFLLEPLATLTSQRMILSALVATVAAIVLACGWVASRRPESAPRVTLPSSITAERVRWRLILLWIGLAAAPSMLLVAVTTLITTDIAAMPLLWLPPLAAFLLTSMLAFSSWGPVVTKWSRRLLPIAVTVALFTVLRQSRSPIALIVAIQILALASASAACHGRLAAFRPRREQLTLYFVAMSFGGALGGVFAALIAPSLFQVISEFGIALGLACWLGLGALPGTPAITAPRTWKVWTHRALDVALPLAIAAVTIYLGLLAPYAMAKSDRWWLVGCFGVPPLLCFLLAGRPGRFGFAIFLVGVLAVGSVAEPRPSIHIERSFFGLHRVLAENITDRESNVRKRFHTLKHGTTEHGVQRMEEPDVELPRAYYHPSGPAGDIFRMMNEEGRIRTATFVGMGVGSLASYGREGQIFTFAEIDPAVIRIATDTRLFQFLARSKAEIVLLVGDGRKIVASMPEGSQDVIVLDAFSSDAIPPHLLTVEAMETYLRALAPGGLLVYHVSNRHLRLEEVVAANAAKLGLVAVERQDIDVSTDDENEGIKRSSQWAIVARSKDDLGGLNRLATWFPLRPSKGVEPWTDDYSSVVGILALW